jgi:hypothetical protein
LLGVDFSKEAGRINIGSRIVYCGKASKIKFDLVGPGPGDYPFGALSLFNVVRYSLMPVVI